MIVLFKHRWNRVAVRIATACFLIGTIIMLIALMASNEVIITCGIVFFVLYILVTIIMLFILFVNTVSNFRDIHEHMMSLIIILMNFPVTLLYANFLNI